MYVELFRHRGKNGKFASEIDGYIELWEHIDFDDFTLELERWLKSNEKIKKHFLFWKVPEKIKKKVI